MNSRSSRPSAGQRVKSDLEHRLSEQEWQAGAKLPSIRQLARQYDVSPLTVSRVIRELDEAGQVITVPSKGIFIPAKIEDRGNETAQDASWQLELLKRHPARSFSVTVPQRTPMDTINLATGTMSNEAVPLDSLRRAIRKTARGYTEGPIWQRSAQGGLALREWFSEDLSGIGIRVPPDSILIVSSTHQAFRVMANTIIDPGDVVLIESPSDPIVMAVFELAGAHCVGVELDRHGMQIEQARELVSRLRPKAIVTCPSGQVPTGTTMSRERREKLAELAAETRTLIIEYDNGNEVYYDGPPPRPIKSWDRAGNVAYVRDISRITMAGFRVGCLALEGPLLQRLVDSKRRDDLLTSTLGQYALLNYVTSTDYQSNLTRLREFYRPRRDSVLRSLESNMPASVSWVPPNVGFHVWLSLDLGISAQLVAEEAAMQGVIVAPSQIFSLDGSLDSALRITFSTNPPATLHKGIERLGRAIKTVMGFKEPRTMTRTFEVV